MIVGAFGVYLIFGKEGRERQRLLKMMAEEKEHRKAMARAIAKTRPYPGMNRLPSKAEIERLLEPKLRPGAGGE